MFLLALLIVVFVLVLVSKGIYIVKQAEVVIIERFGKYTRTLQSGLHLIFPLIDRARLFTWRFVKQDFKGNLFVQNVSCTRLDLRETVYDFARQNVITADNVVIEINAMVYFQVTDPFNAVYEINNLP